MDQFKKIALGFFAFVWCIGVILVVVEYHFFSQQAHHMIQLQGEYRNYIQMVKTIVDDYAKTKERLVLLEELVKDEKKNVDIETGTQGAPFPEGARVFSSDDQDTDTQDSFLVVNRELEYLKESAIVHIKEAQLEAYFKNIDWDEWREYTDQVLAPKPKERKGKTVSRTRRPTSSPEITTPPVISQKYGKRDMHFSWPIDRSRFWLSSFFGPRRKRNGSMGFHHGIDMAALKGTSVMAAASGVVEEACYARGYGNTIVVSHNGKYKTRYAHLDTMFVHVGQQVSRGALIGSVGTTGHVRSIRGKDPSHLHFELYMFGKKVNPMHFLV